MIRPAEVTPVLVLLITAPAVSIAVRCWVHPDAVRYRRNRRTARRYNDLKGNAR